MVMNDFSNTEKSRSMDLGPAARVCYNATKMIHMKNVWIPFLILGFVCLGMAASLVVADDDQNVQGLNITAQDNNDNVAILMQDIVDKLIAQGVTPDVATEIAIKMIEKLLEQGVPLNKIGEIITKIVG